MHRQLVFSLLLLMLIGNLPTTNAANPPSSTPSSQPLAVQSQSSSLKLQLAPKLTVGMAYQPHSYRRSDTEYQDRVLPTAPDLPYLPKFSGQTKYVSGYLCSNLRSGMGAQLRFAAREDEKTVINWYAQAFQQTGWNVEPLNTDSLRVSASMPDGHYCQVVAVQANSIPGYRTDCRILYRGPR